MLNVYFIDTNVGQELTLFYFNDLETFSIYLNRKRVLLSSRVFKAPAQQAGASTDSISFYSSDKIMTLLLYFCFPAMLKYGARMKKYVKIGESYAL